MRLRWLTIGAALGVLAWLLPWVLLRETEPETFYVLTYTRNTGDRVWPEKGIPDPAPMLANISDYPVELAFRCKIRSWSISSNDSFTDVDKTAWLRIQANLIDDSKFNCLSQFVRPPFVRLMRGTDPELRQNEMNFRE